MKTLIELLEEVKNHPQLLELVKQADEIVEETGDYDDTLSEFITLEAYVTDCIDHLKSKSKTK